MSDVWVRDARSFFCDVWCAFEGDGFELCDQYGVPEWLEYEIDGVGLAGVFSEGIDAAFAALALGVAPGQPFLVRFRQPKHWQDYWGEWDSDGLAGDIIGVSPMTARDVAEAWEGWIALGYTLP